MSLTGPSFLERHGKPPIIRRYGSWPLLLAGMWLSWIGYVIAGIWHIRRQPGDVPFPSLSRFDQFFDRRAKGEGRGLRLYASWPFILVGTALIGIAILIGGVWAPTFDD
jgi:hypothetical protein